MSGDTLFSIARDEKKYKTLTNIDIGTKAKVLLSEESFLDETSNASNAFSKGVLELLQRSRRVPTQ